MNRSSGAHRRSGSDDRHQHPWVALDHVEDLAHELRNLVADGDEPRALIALGTVTPLIRWRQGRPGKGLGHLVSERYHEGMAMTLRLTDDEHQALRELAQSEGISMQEAARRAVRAYVERSQHQARVSEASQRVRDAHADALRRLGE